MLTKLVSSYQKAKIAAIRKFSDDNYDVMDEPGLLDNGYIRAKIQQLKTEYTKLEKEIELLIQYDKKDDYHQQKLSALMEMKDDIFLHLAFLSSNSFNNLDGAAAMIENIGTDFSICLKALKNAQLGNETEALRLFDQYFQLHPVPMDHFLINRVYGELLYKQNHLKKAVQFLRKAVEKRPGELEVHTILLQAYQKLGNEQMSKVHQDIQTLLGGVSTEYS